MLELVVFLLSATGLTIILTLSKIFKPIRDRLPALEPLLGCPMCMGFWVGAFYSMLFFGTALWSIQLGFAISLLSWLAGTLGLYLEALAHAVAEE